MTGDIQIFGGIGTDRNEISFDNVKAQLDAIKGSTEIALHIWSPGGDVMEGESIYNLLRNSGKQITTYIEGTCASIATLIAAAGSKVVMNRTGRFMIHNPKISGLNTQADARDLRHIASQLDKVKTLLIDVYDRKTTLGKPKLWELYDNETWYTADEALKAGFVDEVVDAHKAVAKVDLKHYNMKNEGLLTKIQNLFKLTKFKAEYTETLADGRVIIVMSEDEDWTGKQVILQDGTELAPGSYQLASGKVFTVGESGVIETVEDPTAVVEPVEQSAEQQATPEDMKQIDELKAQLAEALAGKQAAEALAQQSQAAAQTAKADTLKIQNRLTMIEKDFIKLQEEAGETVGDKTPPGKGPAFKNMDKKQPQEDPMGDYALKFFKQRNLIKSDED